MQKGAHSEGVSTIAEGYVAHAEGNLTEALGDITHAEGFSVVARGDRSHAEGDSEPAAETYVYSFTVTKPLTIPPIQLFSSPRQRIPIGIKALRIIFCNKFFNLHFYPFNT